MCREYNIIHSCGHVQKEARVCILSNACMTLDSSSIIQIPSSCIPCIWDPAYPSWEQQIFISQPTVERLMQAEQMWTRFYKIWLDGNNIPKRPRPTSHHSDEDDVISPSSTPHTHIKTQTQILTDDLEKLHHWLQLLLESRRIPSSWNTQIPGRIRSCDKLIFNTLLRKIVHYEISIREATLPLSKEDGTLKQELLTKVLIEDLDEDRRECIICRIPYGPAPHDTDKDEDEEVEEAETPVKLPCGHVFGETCIVTAFEQLAWTCPYCRAPYCKDMFVLNQTMETEEDGSPWWMEWLKRPIVYGEEL